RARGANGETGLEELIALDLGGEIELDPELEKAMASISEMEGPTEHGFRDPADDEATMAALRAALDDGDLPAAYAAFDRLGDPRPAAALFVDVAGSLDLNEDLDAVNATYELCRRAISVSPESSRGYLLAMTALCRLGRGNEAIDIGLGNRHRREVLFETYELLCTFRRLEEAAEILPEDARHGHADLGDHYYNLGCKLHASHPEIALALYKGAIACGSPSPQAE